MSQEETFEKKLEVELNGIGKKIFPSIDSVIKWAENEISQWGSLSNLAKDNPLINNYNPFHDLHGRAQRFLDISNAYAGETNPAQRQNYFNSLKSLFSAPDYLSCDSPPVQLAISLAKTNMSAAWVVILQARKQIIKDQHINNQLDFVNAVISAHNEGLDVSKAIEGQKHSLDKLRGEWDQIFSEIDSKYKDRLNTNKEAARNLKKGAIKQIKAYRDQRIDHESKMERLQKDFSTEMRLRAAERYWGKKRKINKARSVTAFKILCLVMGLGGLALSGIFYLENKFLEVPEAFNIMHTLALLTPTAIYFWLIRIFANEYRHNQAFADDAEERVAMIYTFKALEHDERVGDEERLIILNALFRPHEKNVEESIPLPAWEAVIKKMSK